MSDLLIGNSAPPSSRISDRLRFTEGTRLTSLNWGAFSGILTRVDKPPELWEPASDPATGVSLGLAGRVAFDEELWRKADTLPYKGGKACKLLLRAWLRGEHEFLNILNGACAVLLFDPIEKALHLITDRLGAFPVYRAAAGTDLRLCSHADVLVDWIAEEGRSSEIDFDTLAEFVATGSSAPPYTYHRNVEQLEPAAHYTFTLHGTGVSTRQELYWNPLQLHIEEKLSVPEWIEMLADTLRLAARRRTAEILGKAVLLLSGGLDSRAILFGARDPSKIECVTFCDRENNESRTAMQLAAAANASHHLILRDPEHYARGAMASVRVSGGLGSIQDAHYHNLLQELNRLRGDVVLTGCYADYLLKGLAFNKEPLTVFGRPLPIYRPAGFTPCFYQPHFPLAPEWHARAEARMAERIPVPLRNDYTKHPFAVEDLRIRPLSREADALGRHYTMRTLGWDPVMADNGIVDLYARMPSAVKMDFRIYSRAVARLVGEPGRHIVNNNYGTPLEAGLVRVAVADVIRRVKRKTRMFGDRRIGRGPSIASDGSWPNFSVYVARSAFIPQLWSSPSPTVRELFTSMLGRDPWGLSVQQWAAEADLFLRLLTIKLWLDQRQSRWFVRL